VEKDSQDNYEPKRPPEQEAGPLLIDLIMLEPDDPKLLRSRQRRGTIQQTQRGSNPAGSNLLHIQLILTESNV
jgi:hypothetical protein